MKFLQSTIEAFSALITVSTANFVLYSGHAGGNGVSPNLFGRHVLEPNPDCDALPNALVWPKEDDVNSSNNFRCEGDGLFLWSRPKRY